MVILEWLKSVKGRNCDHLDLGSKLTRTILFCPRESNFYGTFPCVAVLVSSPKFQSYL